MVERCTDKINGSKFSQNGKLGHRICTVISKVRSFMCRSDEGQLQA